MPGVGVGLFRLLRGLGLARALLGLVESRQGSAELLGLLERRVCSLGLGANHDGRLSMVTWYRWVILIGVLVVITREQELTLDGSDCCERKTRWSMDMVAPEVGWCPLLNAPEAAPASSPAGMP